MAEVLYNKVQIQLLVAVLENKFYGASPCELSLYLHLSQGKVLDKLFIAQVLAN